MNKKMIAWLSLAFLSVFSASLALAAGRADIVVGKKLGGKVVDVSDVGVVDIQVAGVGVVPVRIASVAVPAKGSTHAKAAQAVLRSTCLNKQAEAEVVGEDTAGHPIARVSCGSANADLALLETGYAWNVLPGAIDAVLREAESEAKARKLGVWAAQ